MNQPRSGSSLGRVRNRVSERGLRTALPFANRFGTRALAGAAAALGAIAEPDAFCSVELESGLPFEFGLRDFYWNRLLSPTYQYEPEIGEALRRLATTDYVFLDCGANYGYWTLHAAAPVFGAKRTVAVEAHPVTYERLASNVERAQERSSHELDILTVHAAIDEFGGHEVVLQDPGKHAGATVAPSEGRVIKNKFSVQATCIDELLDGGAAPSVIKLDVEGLEIAAIRGAEHAISRGSLLVYEDHGADADAQVSQYVESIGLTIAEFTSGVFTPMTYEKLLQQRDNPRKGYNYFAALPDSPLWQALK